MYSREYPEDILHAMHWRDIEVNLPIICEMLGSLPQSRGKNKAEYETSILKAKLAYERAIIMPRKKQPNGNNPPTTTQHNTPITSRWLNVPLSDEHVAFIEGAKVTLEDIGARLLLMCSEGWDITIKRDDKSGGFSCFGFTDNPSVPNDRVGLSGWADNPTDAAFVFVYKYRDVLESVIPVGTDSTKRRFR